MNDRQAAEEDLLATSEAIGRDGRRLVELERAKRDLSPGDPRVDELSEEVVEVAQETLVKARAERDLARSLGESG